jgi:hypothetical protein
MGSSPSSIMATCILNVFVLTTCGSVLRTSHINKSDLWVRLFTPCWVKIHYVFRKWVVILVVSWLLVS